VTDLVRPTAEDAATAATELATATGADRHDVAVVLGSGWAPAADALGSPDAEVRSPSWPGSPRRPPRGTAARSAR
jgi:purine-nucleoside phosphorylase